MEESDVVRNMACLRMLAGVIEFSAALFMLKCGRISTALRINSLLGLIGPCVLLTVTLIGLYGLIGKVSFLKLALILAAVSVIFFATS